MERLEGKLVRLRPMKDSDYEYFAALKNDLRTQAWNQRLPMANTAAMMKEKFEKAAKRPNSADFSIEKLDGTLIGHIGYHEGTPRLDATIGVVTGHEHWGKGYSQEAHELMLHYLFEERGLQAVRLWTQSANERGVAAAKKMGFKVGARFRENTIANGKYSDTIYMDVLREEYYKSRGMTDRIGSLK
ncbi:MAG: GNAT family N-acetyltransferase [Euryarchaeota archaeon]|nr:GNAT family N-acetyltransferase [Euryarchaeota archaeon]